mmetsp:Transcript_5606/g.11895  ORF Transcript_5606/g.11895 Transcript_5606/m.11895 type:complete len:216 (-) Transcript_5606:642-1289(-)
MSRSGRTISRPFGPLWRTLDPHAPIPMPRWMPQRNKKTTTIAMRGSRSCPFILCLSAGGGSPKGLGPEARSSATRDWPDSERARASFARPSSIPGPRPLGGGGSGCVFTTATTIAAMPIAITSSMENNKQRREDARSSNTCPWIGSFRTKILSTAAATTSLAMVTTEEMSVTTAEIPQQRHPGKGCGTDRPSRTTPCTKRRIPSCTFSGTRICPL